MRFSSFCFFLIHIVQICFQLQKALSLLPIERDLGKFIFNQKKNILYLMLFIHISPGSLNIPSILKRIHQVILDIIYIRRVQDTFTISHCQLERLSLIMYGIARRRNGNIALSLFIWVALFSYHFYMTVHLISMPKKEAYNVDGY